MLLALHAISAEHVVVQPLRFRERSACFQDGLSLRNHAVRCMASMTPGRKRLSLRADRHHGAIAGDGADHSFGDMLRAIITFLVDRHQFVLRFGGAAAHARGGDDVGVDDAGADGADADAVHGHLQSQRPTCRRRRSSPRPTRY